VDPSLERLQQFVTSGLQTVMRLDALESSHPISILVNHPDEIGELFNDISYKKGFSEFFKCSLTHELILTICKYVTDRSRNYSYVGQFYR
jgi:hypothetical protein